MTVSTLAVRGVVAIPIVTYSVCNPIYLYIVFRLWTWSFSFDWMYHLVACAVFTNLSKIVLGSFLFFILYKPNRKSIYFSN